MSSTRNSLCYHYIHTTLPRAAHLAINIPTPSLQTNSCEHGPGVYYPALWLYIGNAAVYMGEAGGIILPNCASLPPPSAPNIPDNKCNVDAHQTPNEACWAADRLDGSLGRHVSIKGNGKLYNTSLCYTTQKKYLKIHILSGIIY